jgi:hypothetical protein
MGRKAQRLDPTPDAWRGEETPPVFFAFPPFCSLMSLGFARILAGRPHGSDRSSTAIWKELRVYPKRRLGCGFRGDLSPTNPKRPKGSAKPPRRWVPPGHLEIPEVVAAAIGARFQSASDEGAIHDGSMAKDQYKEDITKK